MFGVKKSKTHLCLQKVCVICVEKMGFYSNK